MTRSKKDDHFSAAQVLLVPLAFIGVTAIYLHYWGKKLGGS